MIQPSDMDNKVLALILDVVTSYNAVSTSNLVDTSTGPDSALYGNSSQLDSLGLIAIILNIETEVHSKFGLSITLADDRAMSMRNSPFRTIHSLAEYISALVQEK